MSADSAEARGDGFEPGVTRDTQVATNETFGPVAPLFRFETEEDVSEQTSDTIDLLGSTTSGGGERQTPALSL